MTESIEMKSLLDVSAKMLIRCFIMNFALALLWFCLLLVGEGHWGYELHSQIFDITQHEFVVINYCGIAFLKLCNLIFFLVPYIAIKWVLRSRSS